MRRQSLHSPEGRGTFRGSGAPRTLEQPRCAPGPATDAKSLGAGSSLHDAQVTVSNVSANARLLAGERRLDHVKSKLADNLFARTIFWLPRSISRTGLRR